MSFSNYAKNNTIQKSSTVNNALYLGEEKSSMTGLRSRSDVNEYLSGIDKGDFFGADATRFNEGSYKEKRALRKEAMKSGENIVMKAQVTLDAINDNWNRLLEAQKTITEKKLKKAKVKRFAIAFINAKKEKANALKYFNDLKAEKAKGNDKAALRKIFRNFTKAALKMEQKVTRAYNIANKIGLFKRVGDSYRKYDPTFALMRNSFLSLVKINVFNLARRIGQVKDAAEKGDAAGKKKWDNVIKKWGSFGGSYTALVKEVNRGRDKKPIIKIIMKKKKGIDGSVQYDVIFQNPYDEMIVNQALNDGYEYVVPAAAAIPAYISAAAAIIGVIGKIIGGQTQQEKDDMPDASADFMDNRDISKEDQDKINDENNFDPLASKDESGITDTESDNTLIYVGVGGGLLLLGTVIYLLTRKKK